MGGFLKATRRDLIQKVQVNSYSGLCFNFNKGLAAALNERENGITHFLLQHADVVPESFWWLDTMASLLTDRDADIISAIIPVKDNRGLTSTALDRPVEGSYDPYWRPKRLTLHEIYEEYEPTFTHPDLLLNTGLMLIKLERFEDLYFNFEDKILKGNDGTYYPTCQPEDWFFSRQAKLKGGKLFATREIEVSHHGNFSYSNSPAWGDWPRDRLE